MSDEERAPTNATAEFVRKSGRPMYTREFVAVWLALCLLLGGLTAAQAQQETLPTDKAGWVKRLSKITELQNDDWNALYHFRSLDPEFTYDVMREVWSGKVSENLKQQLLQNFASDYGEFTMGPNGLPVSNPAVNPRLLDILDLGAADASENVRRSALNNAYNVAVIAFDTPEKYRAWRKATANRPLTELAKENYHALFQKFVRAAPDVRAKMLGQITRLSFSSGTYGTSVAGKEAHGVLAHGLTGIRRQMALDEGLLDAVASLLKAPIDAPAKDASANEQMVRQILYFLMSFTPETSFLQKIEPDAQAVIEAQQNIKVTAAYETIWFLQSYSKSRWATDVLLKIVAAWYPGDFSWMLTNALSGSDDPKVVPSLIAILEDCGTGEDQVITNALIRLTGAKPDADADADWWRAWWRKNAGKFPPEIATLPIPKLKATTFNLVAIRRKKSLIEIADDPRRAYWLISSGLILMPDNAKTARLLPIINGKTHYVISQPTSARQTAPLIIADEKKPGLLVVLSDSMDNSDAQKARWQEIAAQAFNGKYLIALARSPQADIKQTTLWPVRHATQTVLPDSLTTENFVADIARDAEAKYPINTDRVFLAGIGEGGSAVYACSLASQTPFRGFLLLDAPFKSSQLPPLANAKNRRYYLLHHRQNHQTPFFVATAAQTSLSKAGGVVQLLEYPLLPDKAPSPDADALAAALRWLQK